MNPTTKLVIFDMDNTLTITKPAATEAYKQSIYSIAKTFGIYNQRDKLYNHWKRIVQRVMGEKKPHLRRFEYSLGLLLQEHKIPESALQQGVNTYQKVLLENLKPQMGANELLSWLKEKEIKMAVATEASRSEAKKKLKSVNLLGYINYLVTANETETMKPDKSYYELSVKEAGGHPKWTVVIGDNPSDDLEPAKALGMYTLLVSPKKSHLAGFKQEITDLLKLTN